MPKSATTKQTKGGPRMVIIKITTQQVKLLNGIVEFIYKCHFKKFGAKSSNQPCLRRLCSLWNENTIRELPCGVHQLRHKTLLHEPEFSVWELTDAQAELLVFIAEQSRMDSPGWTYTMFGVVQNSRSRAVLDLQNYLELVLDPNSLFVAEKWRR